MNEFNDLFLKAKKYKFTGITITKSRNKFSIHNALKKGHHITFHAGGASGHIDVHLTNEMFDKHDQRRHENVIRIPINKIDNYLEKYLLKSIVPFYVQYYKLYSFQELIKSYNRVIILDDEHLDNLSKELIEFFNKFGFFGIKKGNLEIVPENIPDISMDKSTINFISKALLQKIHKVDFENVRDCILFNLSGEFISIRRFKGTDKVIAFKIDSFESFAKKQEEFFNNSRHVKYIKRLFNKKYAFLQEKSFDSF